MDTSHKTADKSMGQTRGKLIYHAAEQNKEPILSVLKKYITNDPNQILLEIASGSGQHIAHFAPNFPQIKFYPSECSEFGSLRSICCHSKGLLNVELPIIIDVTTDSKIWGFKENTLDYMYSSNLLHISSFECTNGLFKGAGKLLKSEGLLFIYGPFAIDGKLFPESNVNFDKSLKSQNSEWGVRDIRDLKESASKNGIKLVEMVDMPSNNKILVWKKLIQ